MSDFDSNLLTNTLDRLLEAGYELCDIEASVVQWLRQNSPIAPGGSGGPATAYIDPDPKRYHEQCLMGSDW